MPRFVGDAELLFDRGHTESAVNPKFRRACSPRVRQRAFVFHMKPAGDSLTRSLADADWMAREIAAETLGTNANGLYAADPLIRALDDDKNARWAMQCIQSGKTAIES